MKITKNLKKLQYLEQRLRLIDEMNLEEEYHSWLKLFPLGGTCNQSFDFDSWLDSMPPSFLPYFYLHMRQLFSYKHKIIFKISFRKFFQIAIIQLLLEKLNFASPKYFDAS